MSRHLLHLVYAPPSNNMQLPRNRINDKSCLKMSQFLSQMTKGWKRRRTRPIWEWMYDMHEQNKQDMHGWVQTYKTKKCKTMSWVRAQDQPKENEWSMVPIWWTTLKIPNSKFWCSSKLKQRQNTHLSILLNTWYAKHKPTYEQWGKHMQNVPKNMQRYLKEPKTTQTQQIIDKTNQNVWKELKFSTQKPNTSKKNSNSLKWNPWN